MGFKGEVLIADDDEDLLEMTSMVLSRAGYSVARANNGMDAVELARTRAFDVAVLDLMMPGMDGVSALAEIKKSVPGIEVIILTAHSSVDTAVTSMRLGAFDYIKKPFSVDALEAAVEKAVEKRRVNALLGAAFRSGGESGLLDAIAATAAKVLGADEVLIEPAGGGRWTGRAVHSPAGPDLGRERTEFCRRGTLLLGGTGGEAFCVAPASDPRLKDIPGSAGISSALFMPLGDGGAISGTLYAGRLPGGMPFGEAELRRARSFAPVISLALKNYELNEQLREVRVRLAQSQKLESLGMVAGQVSHDFNNLLSVIIGSVQLLMENIGPGTGMRLSEEILHMARESEALVKQLLAFSRRDSGPVEPLDANAEIQNVGMILAKLPGNNAALEYSLAEKLPKVRMRADHFKQALINLVGNAKKSMPGGGKVTVATRLAAPGEQVPGEHASGWVVLEVADRGQGIKEEDLGLIFEPFFTTRPAGKGTGLGLHIARSAARECGGEATAANREGGGAVFRLFLPAAG